jgi:undecaprenyl-diphosphatase
MISARFIPREPLLLATLGILTGALVLFLRLADEVAEGGTRAFDFAVLRAFRDPADPSRPVGAPWLQDMARDFTALGSTGVLSFLTLAAIIALLLARQHRAALTAAVAIGTGTILSSQLKHAFERARPDWAAHAPYIDSYSFPSGHAMMSAIVFLTLGALLAQRRKERRLKLFVMGTAILLALVVGVTRIYLGVHWPTDVIAGWTAGSFWALLCWFIADRLQQNRVIEPPT